MRVESLWIYPVKSLQGISLTESALDERGLRYDRQWMLVDDTNIFVTQRKEPLLAQFKTQLTQSSLVVTAPSGASLTVPLALSDDAPSRTVTVWKDTVVASDVGDDAARFFTGALGRPLRLVSMRRDVRRTLDSKYVADRSAHTGFADGYPLLITNASSLDALNEKLHTPIPMNRFRPNLVVTAQAAWAEDHWQHLVVGAISFSAVKPCSRCVMITTDQSTGEIDAEPLKVLARDRTTSLGAIFGMNVVHRSTGTVRVGDSVTILQ